jgi:hypothetical protein
MPMHINLSVNSHESGQVPAFQISLHEWNNNEIVRFAYIREWQSINLPDVPPEADLLPWTIGCLRVVLADLEQQQGNIASRAIEEVKLAWYHPHKD